VEVLRLIGNKVLASTETKQTAAFLSINAPWFVRNGTLHHELQVKLLTTIFKNGAIALYEQIAGYANRFLAEELTSFGTAHNTIPLHDGRELSWGFKSNVKITC
jgi:hypothetical protein